MKSSIAALLVVLLDLTRRVLLVSSVVLPYNVIAPAKLLLIMWNGWGSDTFGNFGREERNKGLLEGDKCNVAEEATLQYAYYTSVVHRSHQATTNDAKEQFFPSVVQLATHFNFYKEKLYPVLLRRSRYDFCDYWHNNKFVCDKKKGRCVDCKNVQPASPLLHEACNLKKPILDDLSNVSDGIALYRSVKNWVNKITTEWKTREGEACSANARQTLAVTRMRKLLPSGMQNGRDAVDKREWIAEWITIREEFDKPDKVKELTGLFLGFDEPDVTGGAVYCSPSGDDGQRFNIGGDENKLVCDGAQCVTCRNYPAPSHGTESWRVPDGPLRTACEEMEVPLRTFSTTRRTTTTTRRTTTRRRTTRRKIGR